jgi:hypothetical protein
VCESSGPKNVCRLGCGDLDVSSRDESSPGLEWVSSDSSSLLLLALQPHQVPFIGRQYSLSSPSLPPSAPLSSTIPTGKPFEKLLRQEEKAGKKDGKMSRPAKDVGGWAASTSTSYDDDDTVRTQAAAKDGANDEAVDGESAAGAEMDKRGRTKDRIHELNKIEAIASKGGQYT